MSVSIESPRERPGWEAHAADPWAKTVESQEEEDSKQLGGCGHWLRPGLDRPHMISQLRPGAPRVSCVTTQWASESLVTISSQRKCIERKSAGNETNLYNSILSPGQEISCSLNKEIVPGTVHQSKLW